MALGLSAAMVLGLSACGNADEKTDYETYYVVIEENGENVLHKTRGDSVNKRWTDIVRINTDCCDNRIWTDMENCVIYKEKPAERAYDTVCEHIK